MNADTVTYKNGPRSIRVSSDMGKTMVWIPQKDEDTSWKPCEDMMCIEPVTETEIPGGIENLSNDGKLLRPGEEVHYHVRVNLG